MSAVFFAENPAKSGFEPVFSYEGRDAIFDVYLVPFMLLSGYLVPLELFPPALRGIAHVLPFRYTIA